MSSSNDCAGDRLSPTGVGDAASSEPVLGKKCLGLSEDRARPLKRVVQKELETALARGILGGDYGEGDTVLVDPDSRTAKLVLRVAKVRLRTFPSTISKAHEIHC